MPNDYQDSSVVVPVFTGINDIPQVPTASQAGNGSDIIARLNNLLGFLDTDITDLDSRVSTLENYVSAPSTPSANSFILDFNNRSSFDEWFSGYSIDAWLIVFFLPEIKNYFYYDETNSIHKPINLGSYNYQFSSDVTSLSNFNENVLVISDSDTSANTLDLTGWFANKGRGLYIFMVYNFISTGSYGNPDQYELPSGVNGVKLQAVGELTGAKIVNLDKEVIDDSTTNSPFTANSNNFGLLVESETFNGTIQIVQE